MERRLFEVLDQSIDPFLEKYTRLDGTLIWRDQFPGRDGADDFYESFYNWPLLYLLGGADFAGPTPPSCELTRSPALSTGLSCTWLRATL